MNNLLNCFSRDALAKEIYSHLFAWLISKVNSNVFKGKQPTSIAILDIFGFEVKSVITQDKLCLPYLLVV